MYARMMSCGIMVLLLLHLVVPPISAQEVTPDPVVSNPILEMMSQMPPEMKVGQLLLVSFPGTDVTEQTEIATLVRDYGVGGVLLRPQNDNFGPTQIEPTDLISITNQLQFYASQASQNFSQFTDGLEGSYRSPYIPLLVAVEASNQGVLVTQFISGTSSLPSFMALGATWDRTLAESTGRTLGKELSVMGIDLLLGPDLDVLYTPRPGVPADLGISSFGSDPFWVGELGSAYIQGLRAGSEGKLLIAPRHLPGLGSADRLLEEELPTVQKPLEQLKQIDLVPFLATANADLGVGDAADAFLVTHIRYRGFQGDNIRKTTRPISLDAQALQSVISLEKMSPWRDSGGILIADNLGMQSLHRSYDPRGVSFNVRRVTQDALVAGNDLLILDRFSADNSWTSHFVNLRETLEFLANRYKTDTTFQTIVDNSVYRILAMKLRANPTFSLDAVQRDPSMLVAELEVQTDINAQVAMQALTRVSPLSEDLLPLPPQEDESIVIFTQEHLFTPGGDVQSFPLVPANAFNDALMQFYGPDGTGIVRFDSIRSFTFDELLLALEATNEPSPQPTVSESEEGLDLTPTPLPLSSLVRSALTEARWIVFVTSGLNPQDPYALALKTFLADQAGTLDARVVVLACGPPYELDSTEISKLDLYYALYSPGQAFIEAGARALFQDLVAPGVSPVDIPALNYYISLQTMPDTEQLISLSLVDSDGEPLTSTEDILIGDVINLRTGIIVDQNGHPVPDGTPVEFVLSYPQEGVDLDRTIVAETQDGVAVTTVTLARVGLLIITVRSNPALSSDRLELTMREEGVDVEKVEPTPTPTSMPTQTPTQTPTPVITPTPIPPNPPRSPRLPDPIQLPAPRRAHLLGWGFLGTVVVLMLGFAWARERSFDVVISMRIAFWGALGSLSGYVITMIVSRWGVPVWHYAIIGREYIVAGITILIGFLVLFTSVAVGFVVRKDRQDDLRQMDVA